jgi:hypothetical protein
MATQNGHPYQSIGGVWVDRGAKLKQEEASMRASRVGAGHPVAVGDNSEQQSELRLHREVPDSTGRAVGRHCEPRDRGAQPFAVDPALGALGARSSGDDAPQFGAANEAV